MELKDKHAVVIGSGSGIGRGIALRLAQEGMKVSVADIEQSAETVRDEIRAAGGEATAYRVDAMDFSALEKFAAEAESEFGHAYLLSNNVGVAHNKALDQATEEDWGWMIEGNLLTAVRCVKAFLPSIRAGKAGGHIVNNAAIAALVTITAPSVGSTGLPLGMYMATKHALLGYTETLRFELAPENIGVSLISTGTVATQLAKSSARNRPDRYGGPFELPPRPKAGASVQGPPMPSTGEVAEMVLEGIQANRLHILTHPEWRERVERRYQEIMAAFDALDEFQAAHG